MVSVGTALIVNFEIPGLQFVGAKTVAVGVPMATMGVAEAFLGYYEFQQHGGLGSAKNEIIDLYNRYWLNRRE